MGVERVKRGVYRGVRWTDTEMTCWVAKRVEDVKIGYDMHR